MVTVNICWENQHRPRDFIAHNNYTTCWNYTDCSLRTVLLRNLPTITTCMCFLGWLLFTGLSWLNILMLGLLDCLGAYFHPFGFVNISTGSWRMRTEDVSICMRSCSIPIIIAHWKRQGKGWLQKKYQINIVNTILYKPCLKTGTHRSTHT